jgi:hypothetical protein
MVVFMALNYDIDELLAYAQRGDSAREIIENLGLSLSERQVQRIVSSRLGRRPTRQSVSKPDILRDRVVILLERQGKNPRHCSSCGRYSIRGGAIRAVNADLTLDSLVFVCLGCATPGDV